MFRFAFNLYVYPAQISKMFLKISITKLIEHRPTDLRHFSLDLKKNIDFSHFC